MNSRFDVVRMLARGEKPAEDVKDLLIQHNCHYWLMKHYDYAFSANAVLNKLCVQTRFAVCNAVFQALNEQHVPYAVIKGAVLSQTAYGDPFARQSGDIDLLIDRGHIEQVKQILTENEFQQGRVTSNGIEPFTRRQLLFQSAMSHQIAPFIAKTNNPLCPYVNIDINTDILWGESPRKSDMQTVLKHTCPTTLFEVSFFKLEPAMEFIALCLHHYKDMNSPYLLSSGGLRLNLFCDIDYYLKNASPNPATVKEISDRLGVTDYVYYCLYYTNAVFQSTITDEWCRVFQTEDGQHLLPRFGLSENARHVWDIDFEARLFHDDLPSHLQSLLSDAERASIAMNRENM